MLYYLLHFVRGKRRFPRKTELTQVVSDCLDRNLGREDFLAKWNLSLGTEPDIDDPEKFYLETVEKLRLIGELQKGWGGLARW